MTIDLIRNLFNFTEKYFEYLPGTKYFAGKFGNHREKRKTVSTYRVQSLGEWASLDTNDLFTVLYKSTKCCVGSDEGSLHSYQNRLQRENVFQEKSCDRQNFDNKITRIFSLWQILWDKLKNKDSISHSEKKVY